MISFKKSSSQFNESSSIRVIQIYGDLLFDLCHSVLWDWTNSQVAFKHVLTKLGASQNKGACYKENERAFILHIAIVFLKPFAIDHAKRLGKAEQLSLDSLPFGECRLKRLSDFFYRLSDEEKILLVFREKFGIPMKEIATAMGIPEGANKICRAQALRALEGWIWGHTTETLPTSPEQSDISPCFFFTSSLSDLLDGTLPFNQQRDLDKHLISCQRCSAQYKHHRALCNLIAEFPRVSLPIPIRKADFSQIIPRATILGKARSQWARLPWYIRTSTEGLSIVGLLILALAMIPKVRVLYEQSLEKGLETYPLNPSENNTQSASQAKAASGYSQQSGPNASELDQVRPPQPDSIDHLDSTGDSPLEPETNSDTGSDSLAESTTENRNPHIWRFNLKADSLEESRASVRGILLETLSREFKKDQKEIPEQIIAGTSVPGGIQFDLLILETSIPNLKQKIERLAPKGPKTSLQSDQQTVDESQSKPNAPQTNASDNFSWYKSKARGHFPKGRTRLVIWLTEN